MKKVLYFTASWCNPCKKVRPIVEELTAELDNVIINIVDVDNNIDLAKQYNVTSIPTFILLNNEIEINRIFGAQTKNNLEDFINE